MAQNTGNTNERKSASYTPYSSLSLPVEATSPGRLSSDISKYADLFQSRKAEAWLFRGPGPRTPMASLTSSLPRSGRMGESWTSPESLSVKTIS